MCRKILISKFIIFSELLFTCCVWPQQVNETYFNKTAENLENRIETNSYVNFDSVYMLGRELIHLARDNDNVGWQLFAAANICWNAYQKEHSDILKEYLAIGELLLKSNNKKFAEDDSNGYYRSMMINAIGTYLYNLGNYNDAMEKFSEIINYGGRPLTTDSSTLRSSCNFMGQILYNLGSLDQAMQYFDLGARQIMKNEPDHDYLLAMYHMYNSEYMFSIGESEKAKVFLKKSIDILNKDPRIEFTRNSLKSYYLMMSQYYRKSGDVDSAIYFMNKSFSLYRKNDDDFVSGYKEFGDIFFDAVLFDSALHYYNKSLDLSAKQEMNKHSGSFVQAAMANVYREQKQFARAREYYDKSLLPFVLGNKKLLSEINLSNAGNILLRQQTMDILTDRAHLYYDWALHESRTAYLDSSIAMIENALFLNDLGRRELFNFETKAARVESRTDITALGLQASVRAYEITGDQKFMQKVFSFMEESKGNIILDNLNETRARRQAGIPIYLLDSMLVLKKELNSISDSILMMDQKDRRYNASKRKYNDCFLSYNNKIAQIEKKYPKYYQLKYAPENLSLDEIQKSLSPQTLLIQYSVEENDIYIMGITKTKACITVVKKNKKLINSLRVLLQQLSDTDISEKSEDETVFNAFVSASSFIYEQIVKPVIDKSAKKINKLIIIPDGELCYLPFEALITNRYGKKGVHYEALPYLIRRFAISYEYSASLWKDNDKRHKTRISYIGFAPGSNGNQLLAGKNEVSVCSRMWKGHCFTGADATEYNFKNTSFQGSIIQLATHTLLNDREPQKSCFEFSTLNDSMDDGLLYTYELYNMNIPANLAILSSCETGIGNIRRGEGIISLARAFKYAGCPNIIMSLWKVNDLTGSQVMILFNQYIKKGNPKDIALQRAKLTYLQKYEHLHPSFWSCFVLIGNNRPVNNRTSIYYLIIFSIFLTTVLSDFWQYKIKHSSGF